MMKNILFLIVFALLICYGSLLFFILSDNNDVEFARNTTSNYIIITNNTNNVIFLFKGHTISAKSFIGIIPARNEMYSLKLKDSVPVKSEIYRLKLNKTPSLSVADSENNTVYEVNDAYSNNWMSFYPYPENKGLRDVNVDVPVLKYVSKEGTNLKLFSNHNRSVTSHKRSHEKKLCFSEDFVS